MQTISFTSNVKQKCMHHLTNFDGIGLLIIGFLLNTAILAWYCFVVVPSRNDEIKHLRSRNKTLEYWIRQIAEREMPLDLAFRYNDFYDIINPGEWDKAREAETEKQRPYKKSDDTFYKPGAND
jgi:hypothetical protein